MQDKLEKERADAKNAVEEYVYEMREKLYSVLEPYVTEAVSVKSFSLLFLLLFCLCSCWTEVSLWYW